jgi:hypothetical protein
MKKTLSTVLIGSMLLMPTPVFATDDDDYIHSLSFNKIEEEIKARNQALESSREDLDDGSDELSDRLKKAKDSKTILVTQVTDLINAYPLAKVPYHEGMVIFEIEEPEIVSTVNFDQDTLIKMNNQITYLSISSLLNQILSLNAQISSLEDTKGDTWKSWLQIEQGEKKAVWGAQQLYLTYYNLVGTRDNLQSNLTLLQKKLTAQQLRETLGLATRSNSTEVELQIKELKMNLEKLNQSLEDIIGQFNVMLSQDYDTELSLSEPAAVSQSQLNDMDYEEDLEDALVQSYDVQLEEDSDDQEDAERSFTLAFHQAYQNVQDKKDALELERLKLENEQIKYDQNVLMNSLGLISNLDFEGLRSVYLTQVNKVKTAEQDLLQAYTAYNWMKEGLTVSTGAGASSASTTAGSSSSSAAPSGMGF